jgi:hypothetical protein
VIDAENETTFLMKSEGSQSALDRLESVLGPNLRKTADVVA